MFSAYFNKTVYMHWAHIVYFIMKHQVSLLLGLTILVGNGAIWEKTTLFLAHSFFLLICAQTSSFLLAGSSLELNL